MKLLSRFIKKDIDGLVYDIRRHALDKTNAIIFLGDKIYFKGTKPRCYMNAMIFTILDHYQIPHNDREKYVFKSKIFKKDVTNYMNGILELLKASEFPNKHILLPHVLADIKSSFSLISFICNDIVTIDHSMFNYVEEYRRNPEFRKLFTEPVFNKTDDAWTIRKKVDNIINKFKDGTINLQPLSDFLRYGTKVKPEQLLMFFSYDLAPDPLKTNQTLAPLGVSIVDGISTIWVMFVLDNISRMAIVSGKTEIKVTGVQSKRMSTALQSTKLNMADTREMIDDCGNTDYLSVTIENKKDLEFFRFKNYYNPETHEKLGYVDEDRLDLIGQTIYIRTFILCKTPIVCKECYGYNWDMVADTPLYKGNFSLYILQEFNKKMQSVISVKHHSGWVFTPMYITYNGVEYTMEKLFEEKTLIRSVDWNKFEVVEGHTVEFIPHSTSEDKKGKRTFTKERLLIDGVEFITKQMLKRVSERVFSYVVPNNSVLLQAEALKVAVSKHSTKGPDGKTDFDASQLKGKSLSEQAKLMYLYQKKKVKMNHFIYYEAVLHALVRDANDMSSGVNDDTENITMISADSILTKADRTNNISTTLPHGYINNIFNTIHQNSTPSEYDVLYNNLTDRKLIKKNIFAEFNEILNATSISNDDNVSINQKDDGMTMHDLLYNEELI